MVRIFQLNRKLMAINSKTERIESFYISELIELNSHIKPNLSLNQIEIYLYF